MDNKEKIIVRKYFLAQNPSSQEEKGFIDLMQDSSKREAILRYLDELAGETLINKAEFDKRRIKQSIDLHIQSEITRNNRNYSFIFKVAAVSLLSLVVSYFIFQQFNPSETTDRVYTSNVEKVTSSSQRSRIILPDSSIVWLNVNSKIIYPAVFSDIERNIELTGEAYFEVTPDMARPFIIKSGEIKTTVLGTSFMVAADPSDAEVNVAVVSGEVMVSKQMDTLLLTENEKATYSKTANTITHSIIKNTLLYNGWTMKSFQVDNIPMHEFILILEKIYQVEINMDQSLNYCVITLEYQNQSLELLLNMIKDALKIQYEVNGDKVYINGQGC